MTVSAGSAALPTNAETLQTVKLTPEQTLALFGQTISAQYYDGSAWSDCTFSYYGKSSDYKLDGWGLTPDTTYNTYIGQAENTGMSTAEQDTLLRENTFLFYRLNPLDIATSPDNYGRLQFSLDLSLDLSGIKSFRQIYLFAKDRTGSPTLPQNSMYYYDTSMVVQPSYATQPIIARITPREEQDSKNSRVINYISTPYALHSQVPVSDGVSPLNYFTMANLGLYRVEPDTTYTVFSLNAIELNVNNVRPLVFGTSLQTAELGYVIAISTPIVTDGYVIPDDTPSGSYPDYTNILTENNTILQQILVKLNQIYDRMQTLNPTLTPAQTLPRDLDSIYSGINSGIPDSGALQDSARGMAIVPFSDILSISGLGSTFGLLVGLCCAGWVLTRGRGG